uniref:HSF-type DNA-binding domain-containing protein n=1 Tax=Cavia porcellus TaxID=10141 RepID=H0VWR6_CAVPO
MDSLINKANFEAMLDPAAGQEQARAVPPQPLPGHNEGSREVSGRGRDFGRCQGPGSLELQLPESPKQPEAIEEGGASTAALSFPRKLWSVVENEAFKSVGWNEDGDAVVIQVNLFQREMLDQRDPQRIFEADDLKSFTDQLRLYGFRQIRAPGSQAQPWGAERMMTYHNSNFQRGKPELLENIWRKGDLRNPAWKPAWQVIDDPKKERKPVATRHSPRFPKAWRKARKEASLARGSRGQKPTVYSGVWAMKSITAGQGMSTPSPQAPRGCSGEGTPRHATSTAPGADAVTGEDTEASSSSAYRNHCALMTLYNTCYSIALTALSAKTPDEQSDEEEQEGSSDYKTVLCERVRDMPPQ